MNERALTTTARADLARADLLSDFGAFLRLHVADGDALSQPSATRFVSPVFWFYNSCSLDAILG